PAINTSPSGCPPRVSRFGLPRHHADRNGRRAFWPSSRVSSQNRDKTRPVLPGLGYSRPPQSRKALLARRLSGLPLLDPLPHRRVTFRGDPSALSLSPLRGARANGFRDASAS